ncbi:OmpA family protein [Enterobacteriaceae bacterium BIT-l23]|uniref:OmpA family protein n=1 Tax=Jejubacter sp. L23 TaxID=3092086 RepID=UPI0015855592|nr:OmpA family protein [Enterobacteriaceae bacterium BIT-l23]
MMAPGKAIRNILSLLLLSGITFSGNSAAAFNESVNGTPWKMDVPALPSQWKSEDARARVIIFRHQQQHQRYALLPLNVYINKYYHASLFPEHQAVGLSLCPGKSSVIIVPGNRKKGIVGYEQNPEVMTPELQAGMTYFYQISMEDSGDIIGRWMDSEQSKKELANIDIQAHTLSRVITGDNCPSGLYTISEAALFNLDQYRAENLQPDVIKKINKLVATITSDYRQISKVIVIGHADPVGNEQHNQSLSELRANTIMTRLIAAGIPADIISSRGVGSRESTVLNCNEYKGGEAVSQCNQPNRRVDVQVYGIREK